MSDLFLTTTEGSNLNGSCAEEPSTPNTSEAAPALELSGLNDEALHLSTEKAARDEQRACLILLEHLIEVERRRLYAKRIFPTLHDYVRSLGYTDGQTQERIMAARLLKKVPEAKEAFEAKTLTLTTMAMLQRHSTREALPVAAVKDLVKDCESLSTREVQKVLVAESTVETPAPDKIRPVSQKLTRLTLEVDDEFLALLERTKELKGNPGASLAELFAAAMKDYVKKREVKKPKEEAKPEWCAPGEIAPKTGKENSCEPSIESGPVCHDGLMGKVKSNGSPPESVRQSAKPSRTASLAPTRVRTRYVPAGIKNALRIRSGDRCERVDKKTGKRCSGRIGLEADHYPNPFANGGPTTLENLRWVCRAHNVEFAIQAFGAAKMSEYLGFRME